MNANDPSRKFFDPEPKLPDVYVLWLELAQVAHKLEPFARGDRSPAALNAARSASAHLRAAQHELSETSLFIAAQLRDADRKAQWALDDLQQQVERPDLARDPNEFKVCPCRHVKSDHDPQGGCQVEDDRGGCSCLGFGASATGAGLAPFDAGAVDQQQLHQAMRDVANDGSMTSAEQLVGFAQSVANDPVCYNCGHPKGAHASAESGVWGCATVVEHGYPCDCSGFSLDNPTPLDS